MHSNRTSLSKPGGSQWFTGLLCASLMKAYGHGGVEGADVERSPLKRAAIEAHPAGSSDYASRREPNGSAHYGVTLCLAQASGSVIRRSMMARS